MAEQVYDLNDVARLSVAFTVGGVATSPTSVTASVRKPSGSSTAYASGAITNDGAGLYHLDVTCDESGEWSYKFTGSGTAADVGTGIFYVRPDPTATTPHLYVSLDSMKETLTLTGQTNQDPNIARAIETASRAIDLAVGRKFYSDTTTRYFTANPCRNTLEVGDVLTATSVTVDMDGDGTYETTWTNGTDFYLDPSDAPITDEPYTNLTLRRQAGRVFPDWQRAVKIQGTFGWTIPPVAVQTFAAILTKRLLSRASDSALGLVLSGNDLGSITRLARTDPDFDLLLGPYVKLRQMIA